MTRLVRGAVVASIGAIAALTVAASAAPLPFDHLGTALWSRAIAAVRASVSVSVSASGSGSGSASASAPPTPIAVHWKAQRIGTLDLGSPLVALAAADLDGDGKGELYAVTAREVVAIAIVPRVHELARVAFVGDPAAIAPRDVVGAAARDGDAMIASVSGFARSMRVTWRGGALVGEPGAAGFALCAGEPATLSPGKNFFGDGATAIYAAQCRELVGADGQHLRARGTVSITGKLGVTLERCDGPRGALTCAASAHYELPGVGVAFELADLDRDGKPEAIVSAAGAPGDSDAIKVITLGTDDRKPMFRHAFAGGIAGVVAVDSDGDGVLEVIAAVRLAGATRVDLWRLD